MVTQSSFKELQAKFKEGTLSSSRYKKISGVWLYKGRILLDPNSELCKTFSMTITKHLEMGTQSTTEPLEKLSFPFGGQA